MGISPAVGITNSVPATANHSASRIPPPAPREENSRCGNTKACAAPTKSTTTKYSGTSSTTILRSTFAHLTNGLPSCSTSSLSAPLTSAVLTTSASPGARRSAR